ncbi:MAG TPA: hypothetical protein VFE51_17740 [Verrucomicrobiae bacterium]|nr:hypothetical protein [Verrucomicrobiae bacterium]
MNVRYKEDPGAWRKSTLLSVLGLALLSAFLRWRRVLPGQAWLIALAVLGCVAILAGARPRWFRRYYRFSTWAGFWSSQCLARIFLAFLFVLIFAPAAMLMRLAGKDPLRLKRSAQASYWTSAKKSSPLDRLF